MCFFVVNFHEIHLKYRHLITKQRATYDKYVYSLVKYFEEIYLNTFKVFITLFKYIKNKVLELYLNPFLY